MKPEDEGKPGYVSGARTVMAEDIQSNRPQYADRRSKERIRDEAGYGGLVSWKAG